MDPQGSIFVPEAVPDGYTLQGTVPAVPGLYPAVKFTYRPAAHPSFVEFQLSSPEQRSEVCCRVLCRHLVSLRVDGNGQAAMRLTEPQAAKLHRGIFQHLFDTVMGFIGPDPVEREGNSGTG